MFSVGSGMLRYVSGFLEFLGFWWLGEGAENLKGKGNGGNRIVANVEL